jgi:NAD(P)-dependent dehydrogenase (short-subunit alcohol dehydrogenase family)
MATNGAHIPRQTTSVWLITGSSSGIGLALVRFILSQGHRVIATSRNPGRTPELVQEVTSQSNGRWLALDVTSSSSEIEGLVREAWEEFGGIDFLINNAGYSILGAAEDVPEEEAKKQFEVNFWGAIRATQAILPLMRSKGSGTIINISSVAGGDPLPTCAIYAASKSALEAYSESLAQEVLPLGLRVLAIQPGAFRTNFFNSSTMKIVPPSIPYGIESSPVAQVLKKFESIDGAKFPDPIKVAKSIFEVATLTGVGSGLDPNILRIPIGPDCYRRVVDNCGKRQTQLEAVRSVAFSTAEQ